MRSIKFSPVIALSVWLLFADGLLFLPVATFWRDLATLSLLLGLSGLAWLPWFMPQRDDSSRLETLTLASGLSLSLTIITTMLAVYLPGPLTAPLLISLINVIIISGLISNFKFQIINYKFQPLHDYLPLISYFLLLTSYFLLFILPHLGYAEWHEDEAEALMLGVRLLQGEDYAIFLHRKGPAQMLLPVAVWLSSDHINEGLARFPFAWSSFLSVITLYLLGRHGFGRKAGLIAALFWAINGYAIAFGRMVQYQAIIFFLGPLALYALSRARQFPRLLYLAAILLATCLLAHFDALMLLPAATYLVFTLYYTHNKPLHYSSLIIHYSLFIAIIAAFYIPYILDPEFNHTTAYLTESRIKPGLLYNNLNLLQHLDALYSSRFYLPMIIGGLLLLWWHTIKESQRLLCADKTTFVTPFPINPFLLGSLACLLVSLTTIIIPTWWKWGTLHLALLPWLGLGGLWLWSAQTRPLRASLLMAGAAFGGYVFLVDDPRTHLYIMYPGLMILAGAGWSTVLDIKTTKSVSSIVIISLLSILVIATISYTNLIFLSTESTLNQWQATWRGSWSEFIYGHLPKPRDYFGYPKQEGWKAIGALRAQGQFPGDFRSVNEDFIIPIWYNYGQARSCDDTPTQLFVRGAASPPSTDYHLAGQIQREGESRLYIYTQHAAPAATTFNLNDWSTAFDALATPQQFIRQNQPTQPIMAEFGGQIRLVGYDLPQREIKAGQTLSLHLYWEALSAPMPAYRAFVHLTDGSHLWAQQDDDPICRLPTPIWRAGQHGLGQFQLTLDPKTPPGHYPLIVGLYQADTLTRLPLTGGTVGKVGDDFLWLGDITVVE